MLWGEKPQWHKTIIIVLKRFYLFIFRERGRKGEREGNISVWLSLECPLLGYLACNPGRLGCEFSGRHSIH